MAQEKQERKTVNLDLTLPQLELIDRAVQVCSQRDGVRVYRHAFLVNAVIIAARKALTKAGEEIPGEK